MLSSELPSSNSGESRGLTVDSSWLEQKFPRVVIRGVMFGGTFGQVPVEVECKVCGHEMQNWAISAYLVIVLAHCTCKLCTSHILVPSLIFDHPRFHTQ